MVYLFFSCLFCDTRYLPLLPACYRARLFFLFAQNTPPLPFLLACSMAPLPFLLACNMSPLAFLASYSSSSNDVSDLLVDMMPIPPLSYIQVGTWQREQWRRRCCQDPEDQLHCRPRSSSPPDAPGGTQHWPREREQLVPEGQVSLDTRTSTRTHVIWDVLKETRKIDECGMEMFGII